MSLLLLLLFVLSACTRSGAANGGTVFRQGSANSLPSNNATPTANVTATALSSTPVVTPIPQSQGVQPCPVAVAAPAYWDAIIPTQTGTDKVESVACASLTGNSTLQALVKVRAEGLGANLDVYVYNKITDPDPQQVFRLQNLLHGDARISGYNTLLTAEVDPASRINNGKDDAAQTVDLFREFAWSDGAGTLVPVSFPGIFPDLTRYQAELDQGDVNQGHQPWKLSAGMVANALAAGMLAWPARAPATIVSGGGQHDMDAIVNVKNPGAGDATIQVSMSRLEGKLNGIWEVAAVGSAGMTITSPKDRDLLNSPLTVTGMGSANKDKIGTVVVLDHLYDDIGHTDATGVTGDSGTTTFSTNVSYTSSFKIGAQEGIVALYAYSATGNTITGAVMLKELLM
ncbi:MAG: hypothetical protein JOZ18_10350 [Chloroflexi bacterium]|nr:hypothetical protein [Chloroflexota bacterium]